MTWQELEHIWRDCEGPLICHTSGSTGRPAEIPLPRAEVVRSASRTIDFFGIDADSLLYSCISPDFIGGKMMLIRSIAAGCGFGWETPSNRPLEGYAGAPITLLSVVPSQLDHLLSHRDSLPPIGNILVGGAPLSERQRRETAESGFCVWESYGMTETASHVALRRVGVPQEGFKALSGIRVSLCNDRIAIEIDGWKRILTNDVGRLLDDGTFHILGRADNAIISGGMKIHPELTEAKLEALLPFPFMISWRPDTKWGQAVVLWVDPVGATPFSDNEIMQICLRTLLKHEMPKEIVRAEIPRTPNGKVKRPGHGGEL